MPPPRQPKKPGYDATDPKQSDKPFNVFTKQLPPCKTVKPAAEIPATQRSRMIPYDTQDAEEFLEKLMANGNTESFTREQLLSFSQILHASNCVLNDEGLRAVRFVEIDGLYPALLVQLDDPGHLTSGATPFEEPAPFGVTPQQWIPAPPAVNTFSFVHGTDVQVPVKSYVRARYVLAPSHREEKQNHVWYMDPVLRVP